MRPGEHNPIYITCAEMVVVLLFPTAALVAHEALVSPSCSLGSLVGSIRDCEQREEWLLSRVEVRAEWRGAERRGKERRKRQDPR